MQFRTSRDTSRAERRRSRSSRTRTNTLIVATVAVIGVVLLVAGAVSIGKARAAATSATDMASVATTAALESVESSSATGSAGSSMVEIPSVVGLGLVEARLVLESAGFTVAAREAGAPVAAGEKQLVSSQEPAAGTVSSEGDCVRLVLPPASAVATAPVAAAAKVPTGSYVVCIDPGHQAHSNTTPEPIGPGAKQTKPSVSGGTTGVSTGIPEYEIALQIAMNLKKRLEAEGVTVVMTRTVNDVDITNSKRADIANRAHADLFVRIHADGSPDQSVVGISTLYPASNTWTRPIAAPSKTAAQAVQRALIASTGAVNRGAVQRSDLSGFNWAKVPCVLVEAGFMSNRVEDKLLASPHYQDKVAEGISRGVLSYLEANSR